MFTLVLATTNLHKVREIRATLRDPRIAQQVGAEAFDLWTLKDFPSYQPPQVQLPTLRELAEFKAQHAAKTLGHPVLADASCLVVPALQSGRVEGVQLGQGPGTSDRDMRRALLAALSGFHGEQRYAYFECWQALALPHGDCWNSSGVCEGEILVSERGASGFGFDPLFLRHEYAKTFGEMDEMTKNRVSHRRRALERMVPHLQRLLEQQAHHVDS